MKEYKIRFSKVGSDAHYQQIVQAATLDGAIKKARSLMIEIGIGHMFDKLYIVEQ